jgi:hypothetical protein
MEMLLTFGVGIVLGLLFVRWLNGGHPPQWLVDVVFHAMAIYIFSGIVPGWQTLTRLMPNRSSVRVGGWWVFVVGWLLGDLIFLILKFALSLCVGLVMLPIRTVRNISRLRALSKAMA